MMSSPLMFLLSALAMFGFVSCAQDVHDWHMHDPNDHATLAGDIADPRYYDSDSSNTERRALEGWEERGTSGENSTRFSGEISLGASTGF